MPKKVKANGKTFTFEDDVTNEQIGIAIDEYFAGVKKKVATQPTAPKKQLASPTQTQTTPTSSDTEETQPLVESDGLGGPPKMKTFTGFTPEEQQTLQAKPGIKIPKTSELTSKRLKLQNELSKIKVTPKNQDEISRKTDELSSVIFEQDIIKYNRLSEIEQQFKTAKDDEAADIEADKRLNDALTNTGIWNNVKSASIDMYNAVLDQPALRAIGADKLKADTDVLSDEKKEVLKDAAKNKIQLSDIEVEERAKQLYKNKQKDYIETDNLNSFLDNLDESDKNLLKQSRKNLGEHLQENNLKEEKAINAYEVIGNKKIKEYKTIEQELLKYKNNNQPLPKDLYDSYVSLGNEIVGIGNSIQKRQSIINKNKEDLGTVKQEFDLLKRRYGDIDNAVTNIGLGGTKILNGILGFTNYAAKFTGGAQGQIYSLAGQQVTDKINDYISDEESQLRKSVESIESPEGFVNYASDIMSKQIPNLVATSTGIGGLGIIGISSTGEKFTEMNKEVLDGKATYSPLQMAVAPALWGSAEVISEIPTLSILTKGGRVFDSIVKNEGDLIKKTVKEKAKEWAKDWSVDMGKEVAGEEFTNFTQNFTNKYVLGKKDVGLLDNTGTVLKDTFTLTNILKAAPHIAGAILKSHQDNSDLNVLDENSRKIIDFSKQLENESLNDTERSVITKQIEKATAQNSKIIANTIEKVNNMPDDVYRKIIDLNNKVADIKTEAVAINEGNLSNKSELIKSLESDYRSAQTERNALIDAKYEAKPEIVAEEVKPTEEVISPTIELKKGEEFIDTAKDKKGNTYTYVAETTEKDGLKTTKFKFNRSDKSTEQRASTGVDTDKVLDKYGFDISEDEIPEGSEITKIYEIRDGLFNGQRSVVATVLFKDPETGDTFKGEINLTPKVEAKPTKTETKVISPETSSNYGNLTENKEGDFVFFHVGGKGYETIKKSTGGTTATSREEAGALSKVGGVAMYYTKPGDTERMVSGEAKYAVTIPKEKVYDANTDPNNYTEEAKARHEEENPGKAFDANSKLAYITKIAGENGYDMVVSEWMDKTRAQTTKEFAPTDVQLKEGDKIAKPFEEEYIDNTAKGYKSIIPESKEAKLKAVYDAINVEKNKIGKYDKLYKLSTSDLTNVSQEEITKLIEADEDLSQEVKDKYTEALAYEPGKRRTVNIVGKPVDVKNAPEGNHLNIGLLEGRTEKVMTPEDVLSKLPKDIKVISYSEIEGTEPSISVKISRPLTTTEMSNFLEDTKQQAIPQLSNKKGVLYDVERGTSEGWGEFNPELFVTQDGKNLAEVKQTVAKSKLEAFKAKYIDKPVYDRAKLDTQVENAKKSLSKLLPDVKFVVHDTKESFIGVAGKNGRGYYDPATKTIHINALEANARTVAHEVFHSVLLDKVKTDANARDLTKRMVSAISKTLEGNPELKKNLDDFIKNYDENIQSEEKVAELFGYLADGYEGFDAPTKSIIKRAMDRLAKIFGLKPFTEGEIVDMLKTLSGKVATGEEIVAKDVEIFKGGEKVNNPSDGLSKRWSYGNDKVNIEIKYLEQDRVDELIKQGLLIEPENLSELNGKRVVTTSPDDMLVGSIFVNGKEVAVGNGGVYFVTKFGDVWANSNKGVANGLANAINETYDSETGKSYLVLVKGTDAKLVSSPQGVTSSLAVTESMIDAGLFSLSDFRSAVRSAVKSNGGSISLSPNGSAKVLKSEVDNFFKDVTSSTFEKRGNVLRDIVSNLAKSESAKNNKNEIISFLDGDKNKGLGVGKTEKSQSLIDLIAKTSAEKLTKGLNTGDVYAVIEIDGKVKVVQDSHQSYPYHIKIVDENGNVSNKKPVLILPKTRSNGKEILTSLEGKTAKELGTAFSGRVGATANMPYGKGIIMDNPKGRLQETEDYSDMKDIVKDMIDDGMSITEIKKTIDSELGADQVSLAERAYNDLTTVVVTTNDVEAFRDKVKDIPESGKVGKYLSGETIERVEGEAPRNIQETDIMPLIEAGAHGKETVAMAKEVYGDKYIEKTLEFLDTANLKAHEKALLYVSLENEMFDLVKDNPSLKKLQDLVRAKSQQFLRESSLAINMGRLRAIMKDGFNYETITDQFLSVEQLRAKKDIEKAIQSDANAIQKEYEGMVSESDLEQLILSGVEKQINEIYKKLPTARRVKADKAITALENIQKKLKGRAYDATIGLPIALIDSGITVIKNSIKAGVNIADAIELGINHIKEKYGKDWANEDRFREDMTQGFKTEGISEKEIKAKELSNKDIVNQALIEAGFGKEITVKKEKRKVLDWKKLAGEEGSVDKIKENVEKIIGKEAANDLVDEYNNLRASIIEKSLNELERRNIPRKKVNLKTSAKKLAELYNYGLFEKESDTYDHLINTALGMNQLDQESFNEAKKLASSLAELFSQKDSNGNQLSQEYLKQAERVINKQIERLLSKVAWSESNGAYKATVVAKEFIGLAQRNALVSVAQAVENTTSGYISRAFKKIGFMFDNVDTKSLKESRNKLAQMTFKDITLGGGLEFGDVTSPFITKSKTMDLIVNASDSKLYHALASTALGKPFLESADSMHKAALAQGFFHYNLIKILRKKGYSKTEAKNYVSEQLTGQSFDDALVTAKQIIDKINESAGKKVIPDSKESIYRFANDLVNEALVQGNKITLEELEASLKSAETVAGFELGHEPNNIISKPLNLFNSWVQTRTDKAVKDKKWNDAAALTAASIVTTNILNPYIGGGTNWTLLAAQKAGIPTLSTIYWNIKSRGSKLDLSTEEGMKNLEKDLKYQLLAKNANTRMFIGAAVTLAAFALAKATGADDDLYDWLEKNPWANKYMKKVNPPAVQFMLAQKDKKLGEFLGQQMNIKADAFDEGKKIQQALKNAASGKTQKALGGVGQLAGSRLSTPIIPWRVVRDVRDIYRGLNGLPEIKHEYKASGFASGYFQGGMVEQLGLRPEDVKDTSGGRQSSGSRSESGSRGSSGTRTQSGSR